MPVRDHLCDQDCVERTCQCKSPPHQVVACFLTGGEESSQTAEESVENCEGRQVSSRLELMVGNDLRSLGNERQRHSRGLQDGYCDEKYISIRHQNQLAFISHIGRVGPGTRNLAGLKLQPRSRLLLAPHSGCRLPGLDHQC